MNPMVKVITTYSFIIYRNFFLTNLAWIYDDVLQKSRNAVNCVKCVQIRRFSWSVFSRIWTEYGPEKTPYLDTFHAVIRSLCTLSLPPLNLSESWIQGLLMFSGGKERMQWKWMGLKLKLSLEYSSILNITKKKTHKNWTVKNIGWGEFSRRRFPMGIFSLGDFFWF